MVIVLGQFSAFYVWKIIEAIVFGGELGVPVFAVLLTICGGYAWLGWQGMGAITLRLQKSTIAALFFMGIAGLLVLLLGVVGLTQPADKIDTPQVLNLLVIGGLLTLTGVSVGTALLVARSRRFKGLDLSLKQFLQHSEALQRANRFAIRYEPQSKALGILYALGGAVLLVGWNGLPESFIRLGANSYFLPLFGWLCLLRARIHLQPNFSTLVAADARRPILFLRSFQDDRKPGRFQLGWTFVDYSLESRLGSYFSHFGPFIAVGSRTDPAPTLGAARAFLSDAEWQASVSGWMVSASVIVLFVGTTESVNWELRHVIDRGYLDKLILLFPQMQRRFESLVFRGRGVEQDAAERLAKLKADFRGSLWERAISELSHPKDIRAISFDPDGAVTLVSCRSRNRDSYHLAAMVTHYLQLQCMAMAQDHGQRLSTG